jgi:hypothetical protein
VAPDYIPVVKEVHHMQAIIVNPVHARPNIAA